MSELKDLTLWTLWQDPYGQNKVSLWKWLEMSDLIKPYQNDQIQWEMNELKWNEWFDGNDLEQPYGNGPMSRLRVSLWKWLDVSDLIKPFQNDQNRWEMNELKWIEWIEVKWVIWWIWLCEPYGKVPMVSRRCPYESDLRWVIWSNPFEMIRIDEKWMNRVNRGEMSEWMEMTWNNPMGMVLWSVESVPIKVTGMNPMRMSLSKWMESMRNEWIEVNRGE